MEYLSSVEDLDNKVTRNPNAVVVIYKEGCPWCKKMIDDMKNLEDSGKAKVYLFPHEKAGGLIKMIGAEGVPLTVAFKECEVEGVYEGYDPSVLHTLDSAYTGAQPVCRVDLSQVLFDNTDLGEPLI